MWFGNDGEKDGIPTGIDFEVSDTFATEWRAVVFLLSFLRMKLY